MIIAVPKEHTQRERRVALVPQAVKRLIDAGFTIQVEAGAGEQSCFSDEDFQAAGAAIIRDTLELWQSADILVKAGELLEIELEQCREGGVIIGFLDPLGKPEMIKRLAEKRITAFSMEMIPRISRAQSMDALSSQASIAGYKAVLIAAGHFTKLFPMMTTAAGTITPAKVLILGAGVAGLQAIATARRLGAQVEAFDIRPEVKDQVESLGAKFIDVPIGETTSTAGGYAKEVSEETRQRTQEMLIKHLASADVVITTAQVPGKKAPLLITQEMRRSMRRGSVIVDMAAPQGGNVAGTELGKVVQLDGVDIIGPVNLPSSVPTHASQMYARNVSELLKLIVKDGKLHLDFTDAIISAACVAHNGEVRHGS